MANRSELTAHNNQYKYNGPTFSLIVEIPCINSKQMGIFNLRYKLGEGKLRAASYLVCDQQVVWLYSASLVQGKSQQPWKLGQEPKMYFS